MLSQRHLSPATQKKGLYLSCHLIGFSEIKQMNTGNQAAIDPQNLIIITSVLVYIPHCVCAQLVRVTILCIHQVLSQRLSQAYASLLEGQSKVPPQ